LDGLALRGVRYGWISKGGQNVLEVRGDVVNNALGSVAVSMVVIALRDGRGDEVSKWTTDTSKHELGAGEHAPFSRQTLSQCPERQGAFGKHD
jgi:hypothetical protein